MKNEPRSSSRTKGESRQANVVFLSAFLGGNHGTAKSARDFLRALLTCCESVFVISPTQEEFPEALHGKKLIRPTWLKELRHVRFPRHLREWRFQKLRSYVIEKLTIANLKRTTRRKTVVVNGWASFAYWQQYSRFFTGRKVIIVRESPRHFDNTIDSTALSDLRRGFAEFDALIFVSRCIQREWLKFDELKHKPSCFLPNCCEEEEVEEIRKFNRTMIRKSFGWKASEFVVLCPATLIQFRKGQDLLVEVLPDLAEAISNLRIIFVGDAIDEWGKNLLAQIDKMDTSKICSHMSSRPDILDLLYGADVLAFPSRAEAMPRTILEAMAMGTPVLASDVDGVSELIDNFLTGVLVPPNSSRSFLDGLVEMAHNPENLKKMAKLGREKYYREFARKHQFERMSELLNLIS